MKNPLSIKPLSAAAYYYLFIFVLGIRNIFVPSTVFFMPENNPDAANPRDSPTNTPFFISSGEIKTIPMIIPNTADVSAANLAGRPTCFKSYISPTISGIIATSYMVTPSPSFLTRLYYIRYRRAYIQYNDMCKKGK
jgi:hypothetical protein